MRSSLFSLRFLLITTSMVLSGSAFGRPVLGTCDGEDLKRPIGEYKEECRHCRPVMVENISRCLPHFMPGDVTNLTLDPLSSTIEFTLARDMKLFGVDWPKGTKFETAVLGGDIGRASFQSSLKIKGVPGKRFEFSNFGKVQLESVKITDDFSYGGYTWPEGSVLAFAPAVGSEDQKLWYVELKQDLVLDGKEYPKNSFVWFNTKGKVDLSAPMPRPLQ